MNNFEKRLSKIVYKKENIQNTKTFDVKKYNVNLVNADLDVDDLEKKIKSCNKLNFSICMYGEPCTGKK